MAGGEAMARRNHAPSEHKKGQPLLPKNSNSTNYSIPYNLKKHFYYEYS